MKRIVLDPGHGGADPGAVGNGLLEKQVTWMLANKVKEKLKRMKAEVIIVQPSCGNPRSTKDDELYLPPRDANRLGADFYLSIHVNAGGGTGFESFVHQNSQGKDTDKLRNVLHRQVMAYLAKYGIVDRGKKYANFAVLRLTNMPAVLIECLFIDNAKDAVLLKDQSFIDGLANEIAYGLIVALGLQRG
ncbi:cell wall hydrolase/autolysin [Desulforamulus reducens MI-1]|uniref:Cell wall hydrolase/autolysin n=1 Tax=Desulforamulus reducens (strain ATCC BAA-1160 / DSM 100696 / MI-1) TaxID=349161 RepID=A4J7P6_DESRM|nr:N-acetylmuramoyl-L-alanine amidase [Desulforamulus reducens]ABO51099.1 cell wall hydrolase/autolysin [Desulforamulus reducens MI-1]